MHGAGIYDDMTLFAFASVDRAFICEAKPSSHTVFQVIMAPYPLPVVNKTSPTKVSLSWGHGLSPQNKERP